MEGRSTDAGLTTTTGSSEENAATGTMWSGARTTICPQQQKQSSSSAPGLPEPSLVVVGAHIEGANRSIAKRSTAANNNSSSATIRTTVCFGNIPAFMISRGPSLRIARRG